VENDDNTAAADAQTAGTIKVCRHLTKFWQKQFCTVYFTDTVCIHYTVYLFSFKISLILV